MYQCSLCGSDKIVITDRATRTCGCEGGTIIASMSAKANGTGRVGMIDRVRRLLRSLVK